MQQHPLPSPHRSHAVVIGASVGGMCVAAVLARHFARVTLVERDALPLEPVGRRGVPQSIQPHGFMARGRVEIERLFPGLGKILLERGAAEISGIERIARYSAHGWFPRYPGVSASAFSCTRPLLEVSIRELLRAQNPNVRIVERVRVEAPIFDVDARGVWVRGVRTDSTDPELAELRADLVVDASGRGSVAARWLPQMGLKEPEVVRVDAKCNYATRLYRAPQEAQHWWWQALFIENDPPDVRRACGIVNIEGGRWIVTAVGSGGDYAPTDATGWLDYIKSMRSPLAYEILKRAEPLTDVVQSRSTSNSWRRMDRYREALHGLLLVADAVCSYNPTFGQGMTAATLAAGCLHRGLSENGGPIDFSFLRRQYAAQAKYLVEAWEFATTLDLRWAETEGRRPLGIRLQHRLIRLLDEVACYNPKVLATLIPFTDFGASRLALLNPAFLLRFAFGAIRLLIQRPRLPGANELDPFAHSSGESRALKPHLRPNPAESG
jgi:2-polyprenyl-6-methoxyphenol hydroxylase-like FAD-dependent oxidoreductase